MESAPDSAGQTSGVHGVSPGLRVFVIAALKACYIRSNRRDDDLASCIQRPESGKECAPLWLSRDSALPRDPLGPTANAGAGGLRVRQLHRQLLHQLRAISKSWVLRM